MFLVLRDIGFRVHYPHIRFPITVTFKTINIVHATLKGILFE